LIKITGVNKKIKKQKVLSNVHLTIEGVYGLVGPNGAGKTTLMQILASLSSLNSGQVEINGVSYIDGKYVKRTNDVGFLPQDFMIYPNVKVVEVLDHLALLQGVSSKHERQSIIAKVLKEVNLEENQDKKMKELSGGMRKRVGIAQLLLSEPSILIFDEPTAGLDIEERIRFRNLVRKLSDNRTVIISSHIIEDIEFLSTKIGVLKKGKVLFEGSPNELKQKASGKVREYLVPREDLYFFTSKYEVTQISDEETYLKVRVFSSNTDDSESKLVHPRLTEGYLSIVREHES
jgi:ABC-2 type transport system ATP-binding protein